MKTNQPAVKAEGNTPRISSPYQLIKTRHTEIGYSNNVGIIQTALREQVGIADCSHVSLALAAHIWSNLVDNPSLHSCADGETKAWSTLDVQQALDQADARLSKIRHQLVKDSLKLAADVAADDAEQACIGDEERQIELRNDEHATRNDLETGGNA